MGQPASVWTEGCKVSHDIQGIAPTFEEIYTTLAPHHVERAMPPPNDVLPFCPPLAQILKETQYMRIV